MESTHERVQSEACFNYAERKGEKESVSFLNVELKVIAIVIAIVFFRIFAAKYFKQQKNVFIMENNHVTPEFEVILLDENNSVFTAASPL